MALWFFILACCFLLNSIMRSLLLPMLSVRLRFIEFCILISSAGNANGSGLGVPFFFSNDLRGWLILGSWVPTAVVGYWKEALLETSKYCWGRVGTVWGLLGVEYPESRLSGLTFKYCWCCLSWSSYLQRIEKWMWRLNFYVILFSNPWNKKYRDIREEEQKRRKRKRERGIERKILSLSLSLSKSL